MSDARSAILSRIREANGRAGAPDSVTDAWQEIPRGYRQQAACSRDEVLQLLEHRLRDYDATVTRTSETGLGATLGQVLQRAGLHTIGIAEGFRLGSVLGHGLLEGFAFVVDTGLPARQLDSLDAVLSRCALAIAETGTLVLQHDPREGRRALTLVPDVHICIVSAPQVVATVPEAFARLQPMAHLPTTFVSGPSATADIEMTRVKGVHGPRFLHVILVEDSVVAAERF